jgi:asparagine synthase (glutamine-hydrolysing)
MAMGGICGVVNFDREKPVERALLEQMCEAIRDRGPDGTDEWFGANLGLAVRGLDTGGGVEETQVTWNEQRTVCAVLDGVIYNRKHLRVLLEQKGHRFHTQAAGDVLAHAYEEWGRECIQRLRGMFAFAIWDDFAGDLFLGRDRLGQKPLLYYRDSRRFTFGSELKALLQLEEIHRRIDLDALDTYLSLGYVPAPDTILENVFKLPAGCTLRLHNGQVQVEEYWDLRFDGQGDRIGRSREELGKQVRALIEDAVRVRLPEQVAPGALLSGGLDSSTVVGLLSQVSDRPVKTFSVGFGEELYDELPFSRVVAQHFETEHHELVVDSCSPDLLEKIVWHQDEPIADPAMIPTYLALRAAREETPVAFVGSGGDELFGGYAHYRWDRWARRYRILPDALGRQLLPAIARGANRLLGRNRFHERTIWYWSLPREAGLLAWEAAFTERERHELYGPSLRDHNMESDAAGVLGAFYKKSRAKDPMHRLMYTDTMLGLPNCFCMKADKMGVAASVEVRVPLMDHHLVEFAATIPSRLKLNRSVEKFILREAVRDLLPGEIFAREKHTFDVPVERWLKGELRDLLFELISVGILAGGSLFDAEYMRGEMWKGLEKGRPGYARQFWVLLTLGMWTRLFHPTIG